MDDDPRELPDFLKDYFREMERLRRHGRGDEFSSARRRMLLRKRYQWQWEQAAKPMSAADAQYLHDEFSRIQAEE